MIGRRELVAQKYAEGKGQQEIAKELGYKSPDSVNQALRSVAVQERIQFNRNEIFRQSKIDRVKLLKDLYRKITCDTSKIFAILQGDGAFLDAANLEKLDELQSRLIQQVDCEPTLIKVPYINDQGESEVQTITVSVVKKIRFHSQDAAMKILAKAAGFEDGVLAFDPEQQGGPFRGLIIIPPAVQAIETSRSQEGPPENG